MYHIPKYKLTMVREGTQHCSVNNVSDAAQAAQILQEYLGEQDREHFVVILLDVKNKVRGIQTIHVGGLNQSIVDPRCVFKPALLAGNVAGILVGHNHPSGDPTPSAEDVAVTKRLVDAGEILGITVLDHIIIGEDGLYVSLREKRLAF